MPHVSAGEPCISINDCLAGHYCAEAGLVPSCEDTDCCAAFCDIEDPEACPDPELECVPFLDEGTGPAGTEQLGACVIPPP